MRPYAFILFALASVGARADRLLFMPTAKKLADGTIRAEGFYAGGDSRWEGGYLALGYGNHVEAAFRYDSFAPGHGAETADFAYHLISPVGDLSPGLAAGVQDLAGATTDGRRFYVCATMNSAALTSLRHNLYAQATVGFAAGKTGAPFAGASIPLGSSVRVLAEHDGLRFSSGLEFVPAPGVSLRLIVRDRYVVCAIGFITRI